MKIYNSLTRQKEEFHSIHDKKVLMYTCGPTVYNFAHIGNLRTYINTDTLRRWLEFIGYDFNHVTNITDIDDKIIKAANEQDKDIQEIANKYEAAFYDDLKALNILPATNYPHATKEITSMINIISELLKKDIAYKSDDGSIYFSIAKFEDYGKLSNVDMEGIKEGARVDQDEYEKDSARDFVLWKAEKEGEPSWEAPFGKGRPGWHIECTAMSLDYLDKTIDIHTGAVDLMFPHHENEIAQSESFTGEKFVNFWFHGEHLLINGEKMSKSLHNIYTLNEILEKYGVSPLDFRYLCLSSHYREKLNFTDQSIIQAKNTLKNVNDFLDRVRSINTEGENYPVDTLIEESRKELYSALDDDLSTPKALASVFDLIKTLNKNFEHLGTNEAAKILNYFYDLDKIFGLNFTFRESWKIPDDVQKLVKDREEARKNKEWNISDQIRDEISKLGYEIEDTNNGTVVKKK